MQAPQKPELTRSDGRLQFEIMEEEALKKNKTITSINYTHVVLSQESVEIKNKCQSCFFKPFFLKKNTHKKPRYVVFICNFVTNQAFDADLLMRGKGE